MDRTIDEYGDLKATKITWIDHNGVRCIADLCYRLSPIDDGSSEVVCVVTERADNQGMSITNAADAVVNAINSRFPERDRILITERYDARSYAGSSDEKARYAQYSRAEGRGVEFRPVHPEIQSFFDTFWNDRP